MKAFASRNCCINTEVDNGSSSSTKVLKSVAGALEFVDLEQSRSLSNVGINAATFHKQMEDIIQDSDVIKPAMRYHDYVPVLSVCNHYIR